jgi:hypothetical protein
MKAQNILSQITENLANVTAFTASTEFLTLMPFVPVIFSALKSSHVIQSHDKGYSQ